MLRLPAILLALLLLACGGEEPSAGSPPDEKETASGEEGDGLGKLKVPPPDERPVEPEPEPEPLDPQAAIFAKAESLLQSSDEEDRAQAIIVLQEAEDQTRAGRYVARLLFDRSEEVRLVAAEAIGQFDYPPGADNLRTLLTSEKSSLVRKTALQSLYALAGEAALDDYVAAMQNDDEASVRAAAAGLLGHVGSEKAVEPLVKTVLNSFDETVLLQALVALRKIGSAEGADAAIEALEYSGVPVRTEAARALGEFGERKAIGPLVNILSPEEDSQVLIAVVASLGKLTGVTDEGMTLDGQTPIEEQEAVIAAWKAWWKENGSETGD